MENVKIFEAGYVNSDGRVFKEIIFEKEIEIFLDNVSGDNCETLYLREVSSDSYQAKIRLASDTELTHIISLATSEMFNRLAEKRIEED